MHFSSFHSADKALSTKLFFQGEGKAISIHLQENGVLPEHITTTPAILFPISGKVLFENEFGFKREISSGDFIEIEPNVRHWVTGLSESYLVLLK